MRIIMAAAVATSLTACTVVNPYIPYPATSGSTNSSGAPAISLALKDLNAARQTLQEYLDQQQKIRGATKAGVLIGTLGALIAGLYDGSRDLILALGLGAGGSYVLGTITSPEGYSKAYRAGIDALTCVEAAALPAAAAITEIAPLQDQAQASYNALESALKTAKAKRGPANSDSVSTGAINSAEQDLTKSHGILTAGKAALGSDAGVAASIRGASLRVRQQVNKRIEANDIGPAAVAQLAAAAGSFGLAGVATGVSDAFTRAGDARSRTLEASGDAKAEEKELIELRNRLTADTTALEEKLKGYTVSTTKSQIDACSADAGPVQALSLVSAEEANLTIGQSSTIKIAGSPGPMTVEFVGDHPKIEADPVSREGIITLRVDKAATANQTYTVLAKELIPPARSLQIQGKIVDKK